ncbi:(2Fe-2S)-binding protein [Xinfangfangia sp. D13-10-4-6]|uniref:ferric iron reductase n=1 Tax=Pseudogemmobacter hezensis TaxID=2737662 RepID=UPI0015579B3F|nr:ferric iron reductase [Pseudogemmobacter hezensis]NPD17427.1 (2Fe-2S)-binding protein [Pseudogemmobacter hezensis]
MEQNADPLGAAVARINARGGRPPIGLREEQEPGCAPWASVSDFIADDVAMREFLAYEAGFNPQTDQKAAAAFMFMDYSLGLIGMMVPLFLDAGLVPDIDPGRSQLQLRHGVHYHDGKAQEQREVWFRPGARGFATTDRALADHPDVDYCPDLTALCDPFRREVEGHLGPLIERLSGVTRLPRRALWRLAADTIAAAFLEEGRALGREAEARGLALQIIREGASPLSNPQVGFFTLSVPDDTGGEFAYTFRARGGCCRYYTVEGGGLCKTCVLKPRAARDMDLRQAMRHHLGLPPLPA